jgi:hypothetical protein
MKITRKKQIKQAKIIQIKEGMKRKENDFRGAR